MYLYHSKTALKPLWNALTFVLVRFQPQVPYYILGQPQIVINLYYFSNLFGSEFCNQSSTDTDRDNIPKKGTNRRKVREIRVHGTLILFRRVGIASESNSKDILEILEHDTFGIKPLP